MDRRLFTAAVPVKLLAALAVAATLIGPPTSASAASLEVDIGSSTSRPDITAWPGSHPISEWYAGGCNGTGPLTSSTAIKLAGDYVYVYDDCKDGKATVGYWSYADGSRRGVCRNHHGVGTVAVCNKDWAEGRKMYLTAGTYTSSTGKYSYGGGTSGGLSSDTVYFYNNT